MEMPKPDPNVIARKARLVERLSQVLPADGLIQDPAETRAYVAALAPVLGSEASPAAPPPPPDWREAPLFVTRPTDARTVAAPPSGAQSGDGRATVPVRDSVDAEPETGSIFVARADDEGTP